MYSTPQGEGFQDLKSTTDPSGAQHNEEVEELRRKYEDLLRTHDQVKSDLEVAKMESQGQIDQILRLNQELVNNEEEKQALEHSLTELKTSMSDPKNYHQQELSRVISEKIHEEEVHQQEMSALKQQLAGRCFRHLQP